MNDRFIEALKRLQSQINEKNTQNKEKMDILGEKISQNTQNFDKIVQKLEKKIENQAKINDFSNIEKIIQDINKYSIKDGKWFYGDIDLGIKAEAVDGKDFKFEDFTKEQLELLRGPQGLPGKDGKDGKPGKDGKNGEDAETPTFKIGNIESVSTYDNAEVSLDKDGNAYIINMKIPRGRPGKDGADGSSESGGGGVSNYDDLTNKPKINDVELVGNKTADELGINIPTKLSQLTNDKDFIDKTYHDSTKVDKEDGKGLSTNDFTNDDKDKLSSLSNDYNNLKNIPQIKTLNSVNDEVIIDIKGVKKLQELGIAPFKLLDMTNYTNSNPLIPIDNIIDGTYMTINDGYIKTSTENLKLTDGSLIVKFDTNLTIITDSGNYWYTYSSDGYEGGYAITNSEVEDMLSSFIKQKSLIINNSTTILLNNNFWYQKNVSTGLTKLAQIIPAVIDTYYEVKVSLNTSSTSFTNTIQNSSSHKVKFVGLDCENGEWNPRTNMRYNLDYYFDGVYIVCNVTGFERS